tara:strand:- start:798 stop:1580 length:783 start_codon:yes stop_codon:yes gene_type:complete
MIIDSHCHLDFDTLNNRLDEVVGKADKVGVKYLLTICTDNKSFKKIINILDKYKNIFGTYGIHPHETKNHSNISLDEIKKNLLKNKKIIGVGESGLDFYYKHSDSNIQKHCFLQHIKASQETSKTLIVHSREAENDTFDILSNEMKNKKFKILMHCFTGSKNFAHKLLDIGCYFSASGIITFKKSSDLAETFKSIPNDRILVETDSPYLSPEPVRGKTNEPSNIIHTVKYLSKIKKESEESVASFTSNNFFKLFDIQVKE